MRSIFFLEKTHDFYGSWQNKSKDFNFWEADMCTAIAVRCERFYFGRNMDYDRSFGEQVVISPRSFPFPFCREELCAGHYAMIGMASVMDGYPLYADAVNEKGLGMAGLHFPDNAHYRETDPEMYELLESRIMKEYLNVYYWQGMVYGDSYSEEELAEIREQWLYWTDYFQINAGSEGGVMPEF